MTNSRPRVVRSTFRRSSTDQRVVDSHSPGLSLEPPHEFERSFSGRCTESISTNASVSAPGSSGAPRSEPGQHPAVHRRQLARGGRGRTPARTSPASKGRRSHRRWPGSRRAAEDPSRRGRPRRRHHARDQRTDLHPRVRADLSGHPYVRSDQVFQAHILSQPHRGNEPRMRHEIRVIETRASLGGGVQQPHLRSALSTTGIGVSATPIFPSQRALLLSRHAPNHNPGGGSRLRRFLS